MQASLDWAVRLLILRDAATGCHYLHTSGVLHNDLKSYNLLVDAPVPADVRRCKVADFGVSRTRSASARSTGSMGTPQWSAPEVLRGEGHSSTSDVYSFGVVLWELAALDCRPFEDYSTIRVAHEIAYRGLKPPLGRTAGCPAGFAQLTEQCWSDASSERPSFDWICQVLTELEGRNLHARRLRSRTARRGAACEEEVVDAATPGGSTQHSTPVAACSARRDTAAPNECVCALQPLQA